jgi:hypothetical protein
MLFHKIKGVATVSSGSWSGNTPKFSMGVLRQIVLKATTSTNIFDFSLVDENGNTVFPTDKDSATAIEGSLNLNKVDIPLVGIYTMKISNATIDEDISYLLVVQED